MKWLVLVFFTLLAGCNTRVGDESDNSVSRAIAEQRLACDRGECPCSTPIGPIAHGSKVSTYTKARVACTEGCSKYEKVLTCNNGELSADAEKENLSFTCSVDDCPSCTLGKNLILNGETIKTYSKGVVGCLESCEDVAQMRTCKMGVLSGDDAHTFDDCSRRTCRCEIPDGSGYLSFGGKLKLFSAEKASCGATCAKDYAQERICTDISNDKSESAFGLSGGAQYKFRSCNEATNCFCTLPNGLGVVAHGMTKVISKVETVACGESCSLQSSVSVRCDNGKFFSTTDNSVVDFEAAAFKPYKYVCRVEDCVSCPVPGSSISVLHGQTYRFAKSSDVGCSENCEYQDRLCQNGKFAGDAAYGAASCNRRACKCNIPGVTGVTIPVGNSYRFFSSPLSECTKTCNELSQERTCMEFKNADNSYSYKFGGNETFNISSCSPRTGCACGLPGDLGAIADGASTVLSTEKEISCGKSCSDFPSISLTCKNGMLLRQGDSATNVDVSAENFPYRYLCRQTGCDACVLDGFGTIPSGSSRTLYSKNTMGCGDNPDQYKFEFRCDNSNLMQNNQPYVRSTSNPTTWYMTYTNKCDGCPLPWGGSIAEGATVNAYAYSGTVVNGCGRGCKMIQRKCEKGVLTGSNDYTLSSCSNNCNQEGGGAPPRSCLLRWQNSFVTPESQIPMWSKPSVACNDSCQKYFAVGQCNFETGTFKVPFEFSYQSCTEVCP